ncbi:polysaccharide deacetylase family protein [bacterium]|nr:MAG: polysaccharide deacetylase family protein [bacterium]
MLVLAMLWRPDPEIRRDLASRTPVLVYHDVIERRGKDSVWFDCTVDELKSQLDAMSAAGATFVSIDELRRGLTGETRLPAKALCITFADGYEGFYRLAWPILRERGIATAMFVHTDFVGSKQGRPKMNWDQLRELDRSGLVTVASQTLTHPSDLSKLKDGTLKRELEGSRRNLEGELGHSVRDMAYPNGKWSPRTRDFARASGYRLAFTEAQRPAETGESILSVPRWVHTRWRDALRAGRITGAGRDGARP